MARLGTGTYGSVSVLENDDERVGKSFDSCVNLVREAAISSFVGPPAALPLLDVDLEEKVIILPRVDHTLGRWMEVGRSLPERLSLFSQICDLVAATHRVGIVHCDLKPDNVMIDTLVTPSGLTESGEEETSGEEEVAARTEWRRRGERDQVVLIDWNLSGPPGHSRPHFSTNLYSSPDRANDFPHDVYSLGILGLELLGDLLVVVAPKRTELGNILSGLQVVLPPPLLDVLAAMTSPSPGDRPSVEEVKQLIWETPPLPPLPSRKKKGGRPPFSEGMRRLSSRHNIRRWQKAEHSLALYLKRKGEARTTLFCLAALYVCSSIFGHEVERRDLFRHLPKCADRRRNFNGAVRSLLLDGEFLSDLLGP